MPPRRGASRRKTGCGRRPIVSQSGAESRDNSWLDQIERGLADSDAPKVPGNQLHAAIEHSLGPAGDVGGHQYIRQIMEWARGRMRWAGRAGIAIPDVERRARNRFGGESFVKRVLIDDFRPRHIDEERCRFHQAEPPAIYEPDRVARGRHRDQQVIRPHYDLVRRLWSAYKSQIVPDATPSIPAHRAYDHAKSARTPGYCPTDSAKAENPDGLAGELGPDRRRRGADCPLALPISLSQREIQMEEVTGQRQHRADHIFGNSVLVSVGIGEPRPCRHRRALDAVAACARHLDQC